MLGDYDCAEIRLASKIDGFTLPDVPWPFGPLVWGFLIMVRAIAYCAAGVFILLMFWLLWAYVLSPVWASDFAGPFQKVLFVLVLFAVVVGLYGVLFAVTVAWDTVSARVSTLRACARQKG